MLKVLILGYKGFIGRRLAETLAAREDVALTVFGRNFESGAAAAGGNVEVVRGEFADETALKAALRNQDIVYHLISQTIPSSSWNAPVSEIEKNLTPAVRLVELAAESGVKKICFASSGGTVYGLRENQPPATEDSPTEPISPHGIVKRAVESFLQYARHRYGTGYDIYRISNVYGEGQDVGKGLGFINTALENIIGDRPVVIYGDGENVRDYIYVGDVARLLALSIGKETAHSDVYNVTSNRSLSLNELVQLMREVLGIDFEVRYEPNRLSDNSKVFLSNAKIMRFFPDQPLTDLEMGIKATYEHLKRKQRQRAEGGDGV